MKVCTATYMVRGRVSVNYAKEKSAVWKIYHVQMDRSNSVVREKFFNHSCFSRKKFPSLEMEKERG